MTKRFFGPEFRDMSKDAEEAFASVRGDIDRAVEALRGWAAELGGVRPRIDLITTEQGVEIEAELPGLQEDQIDVTVIRDVLTIAGEKTRSSGQSADRAMSERAFGRFSRTLKLPYAPDANSVTASYTNGVLRIAVPKPEHLRTKAEKIHVRTA
jgi:HSP20 family protein